MDLWAEWLGQYFDGNNHAVGATAAVAFPKAQLAFQQSAVLAQAQEGAGATPGPLSGLAITLVWSEGGAKPRLGFDLLDGPAPGGAPARQEMAYAPVHWNFWVRASGTSARKLGKQGSDALYAVLANKAETRSLAQAGIMKVRPLPPRAVQDADYGAVRLVCVSAELRYPVLSQV